MAARITRATYLPLAERALPPEHTALLDAYYARSSWIWTSEAAPFEIPNAAPEQRGFRFTYTNTDPTRTPSNATIVIAVDNYYALYVNGALVHDLDPINNIFAALVFSVPIQPPGNRTVFAVRAINGRDSPAPLSNPAGLITALKIDFREGGASETFVSGDMKWLGEGLLAPGWEETDFDDSTWRNAVVYTPQVASAPWPLDRRRAASPSTIRIATRLSLPPSTNLTGQPGSLDASDGATVNLLPGALAGIVIGSFLLSAALVGMATFFFARRKYGESTRARRRGSIGGVVQVQQRYYPPTDFSGQGSSMTAFPMAPIAPVGGPQTENGDYPPAYMGSEDASSSSGSRFAVNPDSTGYRPAPANRYQVHQHASVHKMSSGGLTNR